MRSMEFFTRIVTTLLFPVYMLGLVACDQEPAETEETINSNAVYSREALEEIEKDVEQSMQRSLDRVDSALNAEKKE